MRVNVRFEEHSSRTGARSLSTLSLQNGNFGNAPAWIIRRHDCMSYSCVLLFLSLSLFLYFSSYFTNVDETTASKFDSHNWKIWLIISEK